MALKAARLTRGLPVATLRGRAPNYCGSIDGAGIPSASSSRLRSLRAGSPLATHTHTHTDPKTLPSTHTRAAVHARPHCCAPAAAN